MGALIIIIGWMICSFLMFSNYLDEIMKIENEGAKWAIYAVFILGTLGIGGRKGTWHPGCDPQSSPKSGLPREEH